MTIADIIALRPAHADETLDESRRDWSTEARNEIGAWENKAVQVEGYIRRATIQGPSAAYAMKRGLEFSPVHLYLVSESEHGLEKSLTAVVTPRVSQRYPQWTLSRLRELGEQTARVRISGWLIWEQFQSKKVGNIAGTMWRINPVLKIEMEKGKHWVALSDAKPSANLGARLITELRRRMSPAERFLRGTSLAHSPSSFSTRFTRSRTR
jgi:hypothetical protein